MTIRFLSSGDTALVVEFGTVIDREISDAVLQLRAGLVEAAPRGVVETVPTFRSLLVHYDPVQTCAAELTRTIRSLLHRRRKGRRRARLWRIPACYEASHAPDLAEVAERTGLSPAKVVALHSGTRYHVYMIGFVPGYPYMGDLPPQLTLPRRADPRVRVPAGSVAIATSMTAIYPIESPGGWHLIGATPVRLFSADWQPPALLAPGDEVVFEAISPEQFAAIRARSDEHSPGVSCEDVES